MTPDEIRKHLESKDGILQKPFQLAKAICALVCDRREDTRRTGQDLLLRALEFRSAFGSAHAILDSVVREVGLFPYLDPERLSVSDHIAYECHRPDNMDDRVLHAPQAAVYRRLIAGDSVVLSAPTSFGKSLIIDAVVATGRFRNIVVIVPTIALIDETRRRLTRFRETYKVITHSFQKPGERNIYVMTQERVLEHELKSVDFFVIDEFYKLSPTETGDQERCTLLNQAFYRLIKMCSHFYMLGPSIDSVSEDFKGRVEFHFVHESFQTVASDIHDVDPGPDPLVTLGKLCSTLSGPTIIFCRSPERTADVAESLEGTSAPSGAILAAIDWISRYYHPDWHFVQALKRRIGIHHARIPRALAQYVVRAFDAGELDFLICTSTLIEGVNTKAKNIVVFDHKINRKSVDLFTFNNIRGRAGRMFEHFVGHVYLFSSAPKGDLPVVDVPAITQSSGASEALLLQLPSGDLSQVSKDRISKFGAQSLLRMETLRANIGVDPNEQLALAETLMLDPARNSARLAWRQLPKHAQLVYVCELIWSHFDGRRLGSHSVLNPRQLAALLMRLSRREPIRDSIIGQLPYAREDPDAAVRAVLDFRRLWASFHFPRLLRALNRIAADVFGRRGLAVGDYGVYASLVENQFQPAALIALEEYGVPFPLALRIHGQLGYGTDFDVLLEQLRGFDVQRLHDDFERDVLADAQFFA